jgi:hypothetical protein
MSPVPNVGLDIGIGTTTKSPFCTVSGCSTSRKSGTTAAGGPDVTEETVSVWAASSATTGDAHNNADANKQGTGLLLMLDDFIDAKTRRIRYGRGPSGGARMRSPGFELQLQLQNCLEYSLT